MAEVVTTAVTPGAQTTEYKMAKVGQVISIVVIALGGALTALSGEGGITLPSWVGIVTMVLGLLKSAFVAKNYTTARTALKISQQANAGIQVKSLDEAASLIGVLKGGQPQ